MDRSPTPKRSPTTAGGLGINAEPTTPFERWVVDELSSLKGDVAKLLEHFRLVSGNPP